jgi:hypothetical protein
LPYKNHDPSGFLSPPRERIEVRGTTLFLKFEKARVTDPCLFAKEGRGGFE